MVNPKSALRTWPTTWPFLQMASRPNMGTFLGEAIQTAGTPERQAHCPTPAQETPGSGRPRPLLVRLEP